MAECIEREKVCEILGVMSNDIEDIPERGLPQDYIEGWQNALETAIEKVKNIPAADVRPERHGRWEINCDGYYPYCSECRKEPENRVMSDFCPNCGAKMDGKDDDNGHKLMSKGCKR